jgi:HAMP domain-containing protein
MRIPLPIKLMISYLVVAGLIAIPSLWFLRQSLDASLEQVEVQELRNRVESLRDFLARTPKAGFDRTVRDSAVLLGLRITIVDRSGVVLNDSELPPEKVAGMENHHDRPEVLMAFSGGFGFDRRKSATTGTETIYEAVGLPGAGPMPAPAVVRVAMPASVLRGAVSRTFLALRLSAGVGVSAAILLSLVAAFYVSSPLRRMRDAARAFAEGRWIAVKKINTGDELEDLSTALLELGSRLRGQLIEVGAQESLLVQAVRAAPVPAALLRPSDEPILLNGSLRERWGITPGNEAERLGELLGSTQYRAARLLAERSALPTELVLAMSGHKGEKDGDKTKGTLVPLCRPDAPPLWLLLLDAKGPESEARGPEAVQHHLRAAERLLLQLWDEHPQSPQLWPQLARLHRQLDETAHAAGRPEPTGVVPVEGAPLITRCIEEVRTLYPEAAPRLVMDLSATCQLAESGGLLARAVRLFIGEALRALPAGRTLEVVSEIEPTMLRLHLDGATPSDLGAIRELARALGTDVGRVKNREREAAWLTLPKA